MLPTTSDSGRNSHKDALCRRARARHRPRVRVTRRGVASVLAMMFVVMFGSLAVAMAIVSKGNLRAAQTHLHVVRAMGAAETGLAVATKRLEEAAARFVVSRGQVDGEFGWRLWRWQLDGADGSVTRLPPPSGYSETGLPLGISMALVHAHTADQNTIDVPGVVSLAGLDDVPDADPTVYRLEDWVFTPAVAIDGSARDGGGGPAAYQVTYAPLLDDEGLTIRVIATGFSSVSDLGSGYHLRPDPIDRRYRPLSRTIQQDFRVIKRHNHALLSPSRIMIGKNVLVTGKLGARYSDVAQDSGHPVTIKSDFMGLDGALDASLQRFFDNLEQYDIDGDNRLRVGHAVEGAGIPPPADYDGDGSVDAPYDDATADGFVDEFDIFINHFDANGDRRVALSTSLTAGTPADGQSPEFTLDDDMALLLDSAVPDRNRNGFSGYDDANRNGRWDSGETLLDYDSKNGVYPDRVLGWRDGYIDRMDAYAKVRGRILFETSQQAWQDAHGDYRHHLRGPIVPGEGESAVRFDAGGQDLPELNSASFADAEAPLLLAADGAAFDAQVAAQLEIEVSELAGYTETGAVPGAPRYWRADMDNETVRSITNLDLFERMPFNSPAYSDWYYRPRYENMVFRNVRIPKGRNALFINCTFVGVTFVESYTANTHQNWALYGKLEWSPSDGRPMPAADPLDKSDFLRYHPPNNPADGPANYADFPDPPFIDGFTRIAPLLTPGDPDLRNTKLYSNNLRFHDCLFVGSIASSTPQEYWHVRNKIQFTGSTRFTHEHPEEPENPSLNPSADAMEEIVKSSLMLPNYSVDIGSFNSPTDTSGDPSVTPQNVNLSGTIVAGVLDIRGTANIDGTLLLTFAPRAGEGPLQQNGEAVGNPAGFNATIGYFGPEDGDGESLDPETLPIVDGVRIVGWDTNGDGLADVGPDQSAPEDGVAVPFYGYGRITLNWNPNLPMPDGIMLPLSLQPLAQTYREGHR